MKLAAYPFRFIHQTHIRIISSAPAIDCAAFQRSVRKQKKSSRAVSNWNCQTSWHSLASHILHVHTQEIIAAAENKSIHTRMEWTEEDLYAHWTTWNAFYVRDTTSNESGRAISSTLRSQRRLPFALFLPCVEFTIINDFLYLLFNYGSSTCCLVFSVYL